MITHGRRYFRARSIEKWVCKFGPSCGQGKNKNNKLVSWWVITSARAWFSLSDCMHVHTWNQPKSTMESVRNYLQGSGGPQVNEGTILIFLLHLFSLRSTFFCVCPILWFGSGSGSGHTIPYFINSELIDFITYEICYTHIVIYNFF